MEDSNFHVFHFSRIEEWSESHVSRKDLSIRKLTKFRQTIKWLTFVIMKKEWSLKERKKTGRKQIGTLTSS